MGQKINRVKTKWPRPEDLTSGRFLGRLECGVGVPSEGGAF